ncbi:SDR family NAD(P)-dependent oxidoreductase [Gracilimonas mengyeensis]|uniref:NAD(P)-dependent dehydrogenase, short-chain alcohol dehydrogenase family n=1 Tax=Gracilimonas mengyeensis TaxID=1302730 RepID=A0A521D0T3_9BACT|nr:SDR family NAD(P)-dependent oxidoreductase [Gracilimonas mengyeensis]SMO65278.1 NAD(P)-dependent dehydrogenase, short-chain alcohol dehydrogenase family [Gracilimonas mengyeensis]
MARIFITGSTAGLGQLAAEKLIDQGHSVILHARNEQRAKDARNELPEAEEVLIDDLSSIEETKQLAKKANELGRFDAVIHNAGILRASGKKIFAVNTLAPYILTCLIQKPERLVYLSSGMHKSGRPKLDELTSSQDQITYSDSKLQILLLTKAVARKWPDVYANAVDPGWVPTKMGGSSAPDDLQKGAETQVWLSVSEEEKALVSGRYFYHKNQADYNTKADDTDLQDKLISICEELTGVEFPA